VKLTEVLEKKGTSWVTFRTSPLSGGGFLVVARGEKSFGVRGNATSREEGSNKC